MNARFPRYRRDAGPGSSEADTSRSFSAALQRRRAAPRWWLWSRSCSC